MARRRTKRSKKYVSNRAVKPKSEEYSRMLGCWTKRTFIHADEALTVAGRYNQKIYQCPFCRHYHLTTRKKRKRDSQRS